VAGSIKLGSPEDFRAAAERSTGWDAPVFFKRRLEGAFRRAGQAEDRGAAEELEPKHSGKLEIGVKGIWRIWIC
jgi:hypothetical protein